MTYQETLAPQALGQYLSFYLDKELFAFDVARVLEVLDDTALTRVPRMPDHVRGVLNLRGSILPVVDMRVRFGLDETVLSVDTCVVVVEVDISGEKTVLGALVDAVDEVFELPSERLEQPPKMGAKLATEYILAMGRREDDLIIILDADRVFSADEIIAIQSVAGVQVEPPKQKSTRRTRGR